MTETVDELIDDPHVVSAAEATDPDVRPTIIAIMNETYSDISTYPQLAESYGGPIPFSTYEGTIATGDVYVSAMGGGTCNSEFEFLTGSSMGLLGPGVYPYMLYNLEGVDSMVSYLKSIGYATSAIHPADAQNWRRDRVYEQLGFDEFFDITSFDGADYFRNMVSDGATYDKILQIMDEGEGPQFIFDVTIANHGGYDTGTIAEEDMMHIDMNGEESAEVNEYVTGNRARRCRFGGISGETCPARRAHCGRAVRRPPARGSSNNSRLRAIPTKSPPSTMRSSAT